MEITPAKKPKSRAVKGEKTSVKKEVKKEAKKGSSGYNFGGDGGGIADLLLYLYAHNFFIQALKPLLGLRYLLENIEVIFVSLSVSS